MINLIQFEVFSSYKLCSLCDAKLYLKDFGAVVVTVAHVIVEEVEVCELFEVLLHIEKIFLQNLKPRFTLAFV